MGDNKAVMRRYLEDVWAKADYDAEKELVAEDIVDHNPVPGFPDGLEGHHQFASPCSTPPSPTSTSRSTTSSQTDKAADAWTMSFSHTGDYLGILASGRRVTITGVDLARISDGKVAEIRRLV